MDSDVSLAINRVKDPFGSSYTFSILFFENNEVWSSEYYTQTNLINFIGNLFLRKTTLSGKLNSSENNDVKNFNIYWDKETNLWTIKIISHDVIYDFNFCNLLGKIGNIND